MNLPKVLKFYSPISGASITIQVIPAGDPRVGAHFKLNPIGPNGHETHETGMFISKEDAVGLGLELLTLVGQEPATPIEAQNPAHHWTEEEIQALMAKASPAPYHLNRALMSVYASDGKMVADLPIMGQHPLRSLPMPEAWVANAEFITAAPEIITQLLQDRERMLKLEAYIDAYQKWHYAMESYTREHGVWEPGKPPMPKPPLGLKPRWDAPDA